MTYNNETEIDRTKVERTIERFIQNDGQVNIYVEAPSLESISTPLWFKTLNPRLRARNSSLFHMLMPSTVPTTLQLKIAADCISNIKNGKQIISSLPMMEMQRIKFRIDYQLEKIKIQGQMILWLSQTWDSIKYFKEHPEKEAIGLRKLFSPRFWFQSKQEYLHKLFSETLGWAYEWLQEQDPLEQRDLKNARAIFGIDILNNQRTEITQKAPIDEFVAEQIRRIPYKVIEKTYEREKNGIKWVNGETIADRSCTLDELYGRQLQQGL